MKLDMKKLIALFALVLGFAFTSNAQGALKFKQEKHDFGTITEGTVATYSFEFTNTGKTPVVISNVQPSTKWSCFIENPNEVPEKLEFAIKTCLSGRKGPCWIDIPADIQGMQIEDKYLNVDDLSVDYLTNEKSINSTQLYNICLMKNIY